MKPPPFFEIALAVVCLGATFARADLILTYTGNNFTNVSAFGPGAGRVSATFVVVGSHSPGSIISLANVSSWSMNAATLAIDSNNASYAAASFTLGSNLQPVSWTFASEAALFPTRPNPATIGSLNGNNALVGLAQTTVADYAAIEDGRINSAGFFTITGSNNFNLPGSWTVTAVPEPSSSGLFGLACVSLWILRKRRIKRSAADTPVTS